MKWTEAQSYCREEFTTDLASVHSEEDMSELRNVVSSVSSEDIWLGLSLNVGSWRWSLQKEGFYVNSSAEFRMWTHEQPNNHKGQQNCIRLDEDGWNDAFCSRQYMFVCYNGEKRTFFQWCPLYSSDF